MQSLGKRSVWSEKERCLIAEILGSRTFNVQVKLAKISLAYSQFSFQCDPFATDTNGTLFTNSSKDVESVPISPTVECEEGFYFDNESMLCRHLCISWVDPPGTDPDTVVVIASLVNAVVTSAIVIIVTLTLLRKEM